MPGHPKSPKNNLCSTLKSKWSQYINWVTIHLNFILHHHLCHLPYLEKNTNNSQVTLRVQRLGWLLSGGSEPICCSALHRPWSGATRWLWRFRWGLRRRMALGCGFTVGWLLAELEATGELFMLEGNYVLTNVMYKHNIKMWKGHVRCFHL